MRSDMPPAAFRLLNSLPVTTHLRAERPKQKQYGRRGDNSLSRVRPVIARGIKYASIKDARRALRVGNKTMKKWIDDGRVKYADGA